MKICRLIAFLCMILLVEQITAQDFSNKGKDFWIPYPGHIDGTISRMALYISSTENTTGEVQLAGQIIPFTVVANQATAVQISPVIYNVYNGQSDGIGTAKGIHVVSQKPVVVYSHVLNAARSGSTLVFPTAVLGKEYIALSFTQSVTQGRSQITVVATEDNTTVEFNLKEQSSGSPIRAANTPFQISLNKGDVYQVQSLRDLTGSTIRSISNGTTICKPIGVFTGSTWTAFNCGSTNGGDNLFQQVFPSNAWGRNYITAPFSNRQSDIYRIVVKDPTTKVILNGTTLSTSTLIANSFYQIENSIPNIITSDKPVLLIQYMTTQACDTRNVPIVLYPGDPEMITINPLEQTINNVSVVSARNNLTPPNTNISAHYLNVLMKTANTGSLKIDGSNPVASWVAIPNSEYSYIQENVTASTNSNPSHNIKADSGFIALAYGMGNVESYGYNAGTNIVNLNPPVTIQNDFSATNVSYSATCSNSPFKVILSLTYQAEKIVLDYNGVAGLNGPQQFSYVPNAVPNKYDSIYTSNGKIYYLYRIPQSYSFNTAGNYPIKITTTSTLPQSDGCSNTNDQDITDNIVVNAPPSADFSFLSNGCINNAIPLTGLSDGAGRPLVKWLWEFSDGTTSALQNPSKIFTKGNNYTAKLTSITDFGCIAQVTKAINVSAKPIANYTVPSTRCLNSNIVFTDASTIEVGTATNTISQWRWDLDNGAGLITATTNAPQNFTYTTWGNKNVYLVTESNTGCVSDTFRIPGFKINPLPEIGFIIPEVCLADANAPFQDTSKIADGSEAQFVYEWKLNEGTPLIIPGPNFSTSSLKNPAPKYNSVGNYTVSLKVTSNNNCTTSLSSPFTVNGSIPNPNFAVQQLNPLCSNDSIKIINQSTVDFGKITRIDIFWDTLNKPMVNFRDDNPIPNNMYSNLYTDFQTPATKNFTISLVAYSGNSSVCRKTINKIITINNAPKAIFADIRDICYSALPRQITQGTFVSAVAGSSTYSGKGISDAGLLNPVITGVGDYSIKYYVQTISGCKDSAFQPLTVWPTPIAKWGVQSVACEKNELIFTDSSVANFSNIVSRNWIFGDGSTFNNTTAGLFTKKYTTAQTYTASLQVVTDSGCISSVNQQNIIVSPLPVPAFSLPSICLPDGRGAFTNQSTITNNSESLFSYSWNFGDPNDPSTSTLREPTHKYSALGPVNVQLKVTSKDGCVDSLTKSLTTIYPWPKASFSATPLEVCMGDSIQFQDLGDLINSGNTVSWNWDLSGGSSSVLQNPKKVFTDSGTFAIRYFFYNVNGCVSDTVSKNVTVRPFPKLALPPTINVLEGGSQKIVPEYLYGTDLTYRWTPATYLNNDTSAVPVTTPLRDIGYRLYLTGIGGCTVSDSVFVKLLLFPIIPNAFSPNGDGINDRWRIQYLESYPGATVDVYDRYGQPVFSSVGYDVDWDGTVNGKALPIGTYYYVINPMNGRKIIAGSITIIK